MTSKTPRFRLAVAPFFNHNGGQKGPVAPLLIKKNRVRRGQILPKSDKGQQTFWKGKSPENRMVPGFLSIFELVCRACYLLENWGARRAALRPYFNRLSDDFP